MALESSSKKSLDQNTQRPSLDNGKTIHFQGGDGSTLILKIVLTKVRGLYTSIKMPLFAQKNNDTTWLGAGIVVNGDKTVHWRVKKSY